MAKVLIIGAGAMGSHYSRRLSELGHEITLHNRKSLRGDDLVKSTAGAIRASVVGSESLGDAVREADLIFLTVPVSETMKVASAVAAHLRVDVKVSGKEPFVVEVGSAKSKVLGSVKKEFAGLAKVVSIHSLHGNVEPNAVAENKVVLVGNEMSELPEALRKILEPHGTRNTVVVADENVHDKAMAVVQVTPHALQIAAVLAAADLVSETNARSLESLPVQLKALFKAARRTAVMSAVHNIQATNPFAPIVRKEIFVGIGKASESEYACEPDDGARFNWLEIKEEHRDLAVLAAELASELLRNLRTQGEKQGIDPAEFFTKNLSDNLSKLAAARESVPVGEVQHRSRVAGLLKNKLREISALQERGDAEMVGELDELVKKAEATLKSKEIDLDN